MSNNSKFYECLGIPKNEDFDCSNSLSFEFSKFKTYVYDHRHYFNHRVYNLFLKKINLITLIIINFKFLLKFNNLKN